MGLLKQGVCRENCLKSKNSDERPQTNGGNKIGNRLSEEAQSMRCRRVVDVYAECSTTSFPTKVVGSSTVRKYSNRLNPNMDNGIGGAAQAASQKQKDMVFMLMTAEINKLAVAPHIMALDYYSKPALLETNML